MTYWEHLVSEYMRIPLPDVNDLDYIEYLIIRRDAFIERLNSTESGREYLNNAYRLTQTKPDRKRLREQFSK